MNSSVVSCLMIIPMLCYSYLIYAVSNAIANVAIDFFWRQRTRSKMPANRNSPDRRIQYMHA